jgi:hypothetical protein
MDCGDYVTPEQDAAAEATGKAYAAFNGNPAIISEARELLTHQQELNELTVRQLKHLLLNAAEGPMTNPDLLPKRAAAETKQQLFCLSPSRGAQPKDRDLMPKVVSRNGIVVTHD